MKLTGIILQLFCCEHTKDFESSSEFSSLHYIKFHNVFSDIMVINITFKETVKWENRNSHVITIEYDIQGNVGCEEYWLMCNRTRVGNNKFKNDSILW